MIRDLDGANGREILARAVSALEDITGSDRISIYALTDSRSVAVLSASIGAECSATHAQALKQFLSSSVEWRCIIYTNAEGVANVSAELTVEINDGARAVHKALKDGMAHVELVSEDVYRSADGEAYIAVLLYQQYFMRVGNQLALMLLISGDSHRTKVKSVACGSSNDWLLSLDMGAAGDFAAEPINLLRDIYGLP